jgi:hypothetical protein
MIETRRASTHSRLGLAPSSSCADTTRGHGGVRGDSRRGRPGHWHQLHVPALQARALLAGAAFGLAVFAALARVGGVTDSVRRGGQRGVLHPETGPDRGVSDRRNAALVEAVRDRAARAPACFTLLVPRPYWDPDTEEAALTLERALPLLDQAADDRVEGLVGDPDPFVAVQDALTREPFDEVIVSTLPAPVSPPGLADRRPLRRLTLAAVARSRARCAESGAALALRSPSSSDTRRPAHPGPSRGCRKSSTGVALVSDRGWSIPARGTAYVREHPNVPLRKGLD